jgi:hypothetical protein
VQVEDSLRQPQRNVHYVRQGRHQQTQVPSAMIAGLENSQPMADCVKVSNSFQIVGSKKKTNKSQLIERFLSISTK